MSTENNKQVVRRAYLDGMNQRNLSVIDEVFAPDYVVHYPGLDPIVGRDEAKTAIGAFLEAFPDIVFTIEDAIAEGDRVVLRWSAKGTHTGTFNGFPTPGSKIPPSGRSVRFSATDIYRVVNNQVQEEWNTLEQAELFRQLGLIDLPQ